MTTEYQVAAFDAHDRLIHCAPHRAHDASLKSAYRLERSWQRWRRRYLRDHPDVLARMGDETGLTACVMMRPISRDPWIEGPAIIHRFPTSLWRIA